MDEKDCVAAVAEGGSETLIGPSEVLVPWWSFTKTVLAAASLRLVEEGKLVLDARVGDAPYTLRHLLQHRAGIPNYGGLLAYVEAVRRGEPPWSVARLLQNVGAGTLDFAPGTNWNYSNVGYLFVRQTIEHATGLGVGAAIQRLVLEPAGLASVRFLETAQQFEETAWGGGQGYDPRWVYHGLLAGSPLDAVRLLRALMSGAVIAPGLMAEMVSPWPLGGPLPGRPWQATGYGLGLMIGTMQRAGRAAGHSGGGPGSVCAVYHFGDRAMPCTVGVFARGEDEGVVEHEVAHLAAQSSTTR